MGNVLKFILKLFLGTATAAAGGTLIQKGMANAKNIHFGSTDKNQRG